MATVDVGAIKPGDQVRIRHLYSNFLNGDQPATEEWVTVEVSFLDPRWLVAGPHRYVITGPRVDVEILEHRPAPTAQPEATDLAQLQREALPVMEYLVAWFRSQASFARTQLPPEIEAKIDELDRLLLRRRLAQALARDEAERPIDDGDLQPPDGLRRVRNDPADPWSDTHLEPVS